MMKHLKRPIADIASELNVPEGWVIQIAESSATVRRNRKVLPSFKLDARLTVHIDEGTRFDPKSTVIRCDTQTDLCSALDSFLSKHGVQNASTQF